MKIENFMEWKDRLNLKFSVLCYTQFYMADLRYRSIARNFQGGIFGGIFRTFSQKPNPSKLKKFFNRGRICPPIPPSGYTPAKIQTFKTFVL